MDITIRADQPIKVTGGSQDKVLQAGQADTFTGVEGLQISPAALEDIAPPPVTDDVFAPTNRPNGNMTAVIAPKLPKSGGETQQEAVAPGITVERQVAELGKATQGGGPDADPKENFKTPGPEVQQPEAGGAPVLGAATGDVNDKGTPVPRTQEQVQQGPASSKEAAKAQSPAKAPAK